jgi:hypothetical protein
VVPGHEYYSQVTGMTSHGSGSVDFYDAGTGMSKKKSSTFLIS